MNSTADSDSLNLSESLIDDLYLDANSLHYFSDAEEEVKNTIYSKLKRSRKRYWIKKQVNEGGLKRILEARDECTNRNVAMAVLHKCENIHHIEDFLREACITAMLQHPGIMPVYDIGLDESDHPFFTMKLIGQGKSLSQIIKKIKLNKYTGTLCRLNERLELFLKLCDAVAYAHSSGVIHLDLKPDNIQLDDFGQVLVCDWGLSRLSDAPLDNPTFISNDFASSLDFINLTLNGVVKGTPGYMAPEQATTGTRSRDHRTDIYSLGAILYTLLCLRPPIKIGNVKTMLKQTVLGKIQPFRPWSYVQEIPESLKKVALRAMALNPDDRYQSVQELQSDVKSYLSGFATTVEGAGVLKLLSLFYKRNRVKFNLVLVAFFLVTFITSIMFWRLNQSEKQARANEERALKNEQKALNSAKRARDSETKLYSSLLRLKHEELKSLELAKVAAVVKLRDGEKLYRAKKFQNAHRIFAEAVKNDPNLWRGWERLGCISMNGQNFGNAKIYFERLLGLELNEYESNRLKKLIKMSHKYFSLTEVNPQKNLNKAQLKQLVTELNAESYETLANDLLMRDAHKDYDNNPLIK